MRSKLTIVFLILILSDPARTQIFTSSNLPIIIINIDGGSSIDYFSRIWGSMKVIYRGEGQRTLISDQYNTAYLNYDGRINIKIRGNSTLLVDKSQYGFTTLKADNTTNNNVSLLGMPPENDWILNGMAYDPALIRDYLAYSLSRQIGEYAPRAVYCELIINGEYKGLYLLTEKIKADDNRVNVIKITPSDIILPALTGGYITVAEEGCDAWIMESPGGQTVGYCHELPKPDEVRSAQQEYIHSQFISLETTALANNASIRSGFPSIIDIPSFTHFIIINELASNPDAYKWSTYFHKDRNGKLRAGPVWDFDNAFGAPRSGYDLQFEHSGSMFWLALMKNRQFKCYISKRWNDLTKPGQPLNPSVIGKFIDQTIANIGEAIVRDNQRWGYTKNTLLAINILEYFLNTRITQITNYLAPYNDCSDVAIPPLVITKINYHPETSIDFPDSDDLEFIEILNNSDKIIDLTGVYFGGTGLVYQFPVNSILGPHKSVVLASNSESFQLKHGFIPCGQFTRHLSNKSENLFLLDAFGNIINNVNYCDSVPWPDADGNGYYLKLIDSSLNNSVAGNWTASNSPLLAEDYICLGFDLQPPVDSATSTKNNIFVRSDLQLYPNPVIDILKIKSPYIMRSVSLYDIYGRMLEAIDINSKEYELEMNQYARNLYILRVITPYKIFAEKIVRR
jgi:hypothetical protein